MEHASNYAFLHDAAIFLAAALIGLVVFRRLGLGSVLGFLFAGLVIGPFGLHFINSPAMVLGFSEIGVVLLLFIIGLEVQPQRLLENWKQLVGVGAAQWLGSGLLMAGIAWLFGLNITSALLVGLTLSLSSTAFALQMLAERNELPKVHGQIGFSILLFQDLIVIGLLVAIPLLSSNSEGDFSWKPLAGITLLIALATSSRFVLKPLLGLIARSRSPEAFTGAALLLVFSVALAMQVAELSMALGAFVMGILLADSQYRHQLEAAIEPFKGLLMGLFFVAVGASIQLNLLVSKPLLVMALVLLLIVTKLIVIYGIGKRLKLNRADAWVLAIMLSQGGEFAFLLLAELSSEALLSPDYAGLIILVVSISMACTPLLLVIFDRFIKPHFKTLIDTNYDVIETDTPQVIIAGFGRFGQIVGRILGIRGIPFIALERDYAKVELVKRFGNQVYFGDITRLELLRAAGAAEAKLLVIALEDVSASIKLATMVKEAFPDIKIFTRVRDREHAYHMIELGCEIVSRGLYASSLEVAKSTLLEMGLTESAASNTVRLFRQHDEKMLYDAAEHVDNVEKRVEIAKQTQQELAKLFDRDVESSG